MDLPLQVAVLLVYERQYDNMGGGTLTVMGYDYRDLSTEDVKYGFDGRGQLASGRG